MYTGYLLMFEMEFLPQMTTCSLGHWLDP
uniref:Uncharacterized protein n=1 Tax=Arundo donax TaxID=35708 RepID=A0A0A8ZIJ9_ARUDO